MPEHLLLVGMQMLYFQQFLNVQNFYILRSDLKEKLTRSITGFNCCEETHPLLDYPVPAYYE